MAGNIYMRFPGGKHDATLLKNAENLLFLGNIYSLASNLGNV